MGERGLDTGAAGRREQWIAAVNAADADRYAGLVAEDVVWLPPGGEPLRGRAAFKRWLEPFVGSFDYDMALTPSGGAEAADWAWETGTFRSTMRPVGGGPAQQHEGRYFVLWRREDDDVWRIDRYVDGVGEAEP